MKVLVCGGRDFDDAQFVWSSLRAAHAKRPITLLIHGAAPGADLLAEQWAGATGVNYAAVPALWAMHGKAAGPRRNRAMLLLEPDGVIAFPGGKGTADMVAAAEAAGIKVWQPKHGGGQ